MSNFASVQILNRLQGDLEAYVESLPEVTEGDMREMEQVFASLVAGDRPDADFVADNILRRVPLLTPYVIFVGYLFGEPGFGDEIYNQVPTSGTPVCRSHLYVLMFKYGVKMWIIPDEYHTDELACRFMGGDLPLLQAYAHFLKRVGVSFEARVLKSSPFVDMSPPVFEWLKENFPPHVVWGALPSTSYGREGGHVAPEILSSMPAVPMEEARRFILQKDPCCSWIDYAIPLLFPGKEREFMAGMIEPELDSCFSQEGRGSLKRVFYYAWRLDFRVKTDLMELISGREWQVFYEDLKEVRTEYHQFCIEFEENAINFDW